MNVNRMVSSFDYAYYRFVYPEITLFLHRVRILEKEGYVGAYTAENMEKLKKIGVI